MPEASEPELHPGMAYSVELAGIPADKLFLRRFRLEEQLARPYRLELELHLREDACDLGSLLDKAFCLTLTSTRPPLPSDIPLPPRRVRGVIAEAALRGRRGADLVLALTVVPRLALLARSRRCRLFLGAEQTVPAVIERVLQDHGLQAGADFDLGKLDRSQYPPREYVAQYEESDLDFLQRWLEHEGIWYRFDHDGGDGEKILFGDDSRHYMDLVGAGRTKIPYRPEGGAGAGHGNAVLTALELRTQVIAQHAVLQDYNWRQNTWRDPGGSLLSSHRTLAASGAAPTSFEQLPRLHHRSEDSYDTPEQGAWLATRRAELLDCRQVSLQGASSCTGLAAGILMRPVGSGPAGIADDKSFLLVAVEHRGEVAADDIGRNREGGYGNRFRAIPAARGFRPELTTPRPRIAGVMHAVIDGLRSDIEGGDDSVEDAYAYAEVNVNGEYRVRLPYDLAQRKDGEDASCWIRMAQPHSGKDYGMHFPLHVGTEVLLAHLDGNPDRPVIVGTVPSVHTASPVTQGNSHQNVLRSASGHQIVLDDLYDAQRIVIENAKSTVVEMYGRDFTAAQKFHAAPYSLAAAGAGPLIRPVGPIHPAAAPTAQHAASRGGARTAAEQAQEQGEDRPPRSFPAARYWDHLGVATEGLPLELGDDVAGAVGKDFVQTFRRLDQTKYAPTATSLGQDNHQEADQARRDAVTKPGELVYLAAEGEEGDPNLQCHKYSSTIGWQWLNAGPEVGIQYGRVHRHTVGEITTRHQGHRISIHEDGDRYEFLHHENRYIFRSGNDHRYGGGFEQRNTLGEDLVQERFIKSLDQQDIVHQHRRTEASTARTELIATGVAETGLSAQSAVEWKDIAGTHLDYLACATAQTMVDGDQQTAIAGQQLHHVGHDLQTIVGGDHLLGAVNAESQIQGLHAVTSKATVLTFADGFTIKQGGAGAKPAPQAPEGALSGAAKDRLAQAETMIDDAYEQAGSSEKHQKPADVRKAAQHSARSAKSSGSGIGLEARKIVFKSTGALNSESTTDTTIAAKTNLTLDAKAQVAISGAAKVEIKGGMIMLG